MTTTAAPAVFTVADLAARWRVTVKSVRSSIHEGRLVAFTVGARDYRISAAGVERFERDRGAA